MKKKVLMSVLALSMFAAAMTGCGSSDKKDSFER